MIAAFWHALVIFVDALDLKLVLFFLVVLAVRGVRVED